MARREEITMNIEKIEEEISQPHQTKLNNDDSKPSLIAKRWLIPLNCIFNIVGSIGGPLLLRFYYFHGGKRNWLSSWLQSVGFPLLLVPIVILYPRDPSNTSSRFNFRASPKLLMYSVAIGLLSGLYSFIYSYGSSYLPVSTSQLLFSTQLAFTALFALIIVKHKFTP